MFVTATLTISLLAMPMELSIVKTSTTPKEVIQFDGVTVEIDRSNLFTIRENDIVVVKNFPLGIDDQVDLRLKRFEVLTPDAQVVTGSVNMDGNTIHRMLPRPNVALFRGAIEGDPTSRVFLAIGEHISNGLIESKGSTYILAQDRTHGWTTIYNMSNVDSKVMNWVDFKCGVEDAAIPIIEKRGRNSDRAIGDCQALQIAVDTDWEFTGDLFEGNTAASSEYAVTLMGAISTIFSIDVNVGVQVSYLRLWSNDSDPWTGDTTSSQLPQFRAYWETEMQNIPRHLAHLLSGRSLGGGIAYVGAVCTNHGYAVSANLSGAFPIPLENHHQNNWDVFVVAHESGHNVGTWHTHDYSPVIDGCGNGDCDDAYGGTIMSYCHTCSGGMTNIVLNFHPRVQLTIENYLANDISCALDCDLTLTGACCHGTTCTESTFLDCENAGGVFLGSATTCAVASCNSQTGACCTGVVGDCVELSSTSCINIGGSFIGMGTSCSGGWCDLDAENACCFGDSCSDMNLTDCQLAGGFWAGVGTSCVAGGCDPLVNDFCDTATPVATGVWNFTNVGALSDDDPYDNEDCNDEYLGGMHSDVWFSYDACESGILLVSTCNIVNFDSDIVVYEGTCDNMVQVECNGDGDGCGGYTSEVTLNVYSGETYLIRVGGFSENSVGNGQILIGGQNCEPDVPCVGDVNGDGVVNVLDLLLIVEYWGQSSIQYDIDENGIVDNGDLMFIIGNWGNCD